ncbi:MAG: hypothetical protein DCF22_19720 [Leptolyngbya sp.]|nr:MAG: hypothetical protein DCF22_19720 [Leptolyngbya sp.]
MLIKAPLVKNGIEKLHQEITYFISQIATAQSWSKKLFHTDFYDQVVSKNPKLEAHLKTFLKEFIKLPPSRQKEIIQEFTNYNAVSALCSSVDPVTSHWQDPSYLDFKKAAKDLFIFMYEKTLERDSYRKYTGESLRDHYIAYRGAYNLAMCPFCGLEDYKDVKDYKDVEDYKDVYDELTTRDAYDHYLDKARYPFAAVNPDNLFPMCHTCNSDTKGTQDVLHEDGTGNRRRAPYPPDNEFKILIEIDNALEQDLKVSINLLDSSDIQEVEKFRTWLVVFQIGQRYARRIRAKKQGWLANSVGMLSLATIDTDLPQRLEAACARCIVGLEIIPQSNKPLEVSFLNYCIAHATSLIKLFQHDPSYARYLTDRTTVLR